MNVFFSLGKTPFNLTKFRCLYSDNKKTVKYGIEIITYTGPQIQNLTQKNIENLSSFNTIKENNN